MLSVGAYASNRASLRKSLTAWDAFAALPPTPRMNSRPPPSRAETSRSSSRPTDRRGHGPDLVEVAIDEIGHRILLQRPRATSSTPARSFLRALSAPTQ